MLFADLLAFRIGLGKMREVMAIFMEACIVNAWALCISHFDVWRECVLWAFVKNWMSGEVWGGKVLSTDALVEQGDPEL